MRRISTPSSALTLLALGTLLLLTKASTTPQEPKPGVLSAGTSQVLNYNQLRDKPSSTCTFARMAYITLSGVDIFYQVTVTLAVADGWPSSCSPVFLKELEQYADGVEYISHRRLPEHRGCEIVARTKNLRWIQPVIKCVNKPPGNCVSLPFDL